MSTCGPSRAGYANAHGPNHPNLWDIVMFGTLFALLYAAHLAADYPLQTDRQASRKAGWTEGDADPHPGRHHHGWGANLAHAATHVAACTVALAIGAVTVAHGVAWWPAVLAVVWIGASHAAIDRRTGVTWWMDRTGQQAFRQHGGAAHVDQTLHVLALAVAAGLMTCL